MDNDVLNAIKGKQELPTDKLEKIRAMARGLRDLELEITSDEERIAEKKKRLIKMQMEELPQVFQENNIPSLTIGAEGNQPAFVLERKSYYKAALPKDDPVRGTSPAEGLAWMVTNKQGDMIKRVYSVELPVDSVKAAKALETFLCGRDPYEVKKKAPAKKVAKKKTGKKAEKHSGPERYIYSYEKKSTIPWASLTAWLKDRIERNLKIPPLDIIGGIVGHIVKIKQVKGDKPKPISNDEGYEEMRR